MIIELLFPPDLTDDDRKSLRDQGVSMDDWDYIFLVPLDAIQRATPLFGDDDEEEWQPIDYQMDMHMLSARSAYETAWHKVDFRGKEQGIGLRYH